MSFKAKVIKVMIATPSDVTLDRKVIRDTVYEWNFVHSEDKDLVLLPVGWDSHASPSMGDRPQAIINKQVLKDCDLLIAVFWTRLGTPTGKAASGTVEEIEEHLKAGKPAMIYFSSVPVRMESVDEKQYGALQKFKEECRQRGLIEEFLEPGEFKEKLARQLAQTVLRNFVKKNGPPSARDVAFLSVPKMPRLSPYAKALLREAVQDENGEIRRFRGERGLSIYANGFNVVDAWFPRAEESWEHALSQLQEHKLVHDFSRTGQEFRVTTAGYEIATLLPTEPLTVAS